jgi:hypothetical protein
MVYRFGVPDVGMVVVEIGDVEAEPGHGWAPLYRVTVEIEGGYRVSQGPFADVTFPVGTVVDDVDAALTILARFCDDFRFHLDPLNALSFWVEDRRVMREAIRNEEPATSGEALRIARAVRAGEM